MRQPSPLLLLLLQKLKAAVIMHQLTNLVTGHVQASLALTCGGDTAACAEDGLACPCPWEDHLVGTHRGRDNDQNNDNEEGPTKVKGSE